MRPLFWGFMQRARRHGVSVWLARRVGVFMIKTLVPSLCFSAR